LTSITAEMTDSREIIYNFKGHCHEKRWREAVELLNHDSGLLEHYAISCLDDDDYVQAIAQYGLAVVQLTMGIRICEDNPVIMTAFLSNPNNLKIVDHECLAGVVGICLAEQRYLIHNDVKVDILATLLDYGLDPNMLFDDASMLTVAIDHCYFTIAEKLLTMPNFTVRPEDISYIDKRYTPVFHIR